MEELYRELLSLERDVRRRAEIPMSDYTRGYLDALRYVIEMVEDALPVV